MIKKILICIISIIIVGNILAINVQGACNIESRNYNLLDKENSPHFAKESKDWTLMVYLVADAPSNCRGLHELRKYTKSNEHLNLVVFQDTQFGPGTYWYINSKGRPVFLKNLGEAKMNDPSTLSNFILYCKNNYGLII